jgi:hypothetical protein
MAPNLLSFVERLNLSLHQRVAAVRRRSATSCKGEGGLRQQLALFQVYHNFVLPHASLRQALAEPISTHGTGSGQGVAAVYAGDGGGSDRPYMDIARGIALSGATMAPTTDGLKLGADLMIVVWSG